MPTIDDVVKLASHGPVSVQSLQNSFGLTEEKACRVLKACWDRGLLVPTALSWFAPPNEDGSLPSPSRDGRRAAQSMAWTPEQRLVWYGAQVEQIWDMYQEGGLKGITIRDVMDRIGGSQPRARKILETMVELGQLERQEATAGGAFGKRPIIYYRPDEWDEYDARNDIFVTAEGEKKAERKKHAARSKKTKAKPPSDEQLLQEMYNKPKDESDVWRP